MKHPQGDIAGFLIKLSLARTAGVDRQVIIDRSIPPFLSPASSILFLHQSLMNITSTNMSSSEGEKGEKQSGGMLSNGSIELGRQEGVDDGEVFQKIPGKVDFRTVGWIQASVIFLKGKWL
jgi:hypothetical protein